MSKGSILVVDDEAGLLDVMEWEFTSLGYDVLAAANGTTALALLEESEFDVIITDVRMPGLSGVELLKEARRVSPATEVIITTGYAEMETVVDCLRSGAFDFAHKPCTMSAVVTMVERALQRRSMRVSAQLYQSSLAIFANRSAGKLPDVIAEGALQIVAADSVGLWLPEVDGMHLAHRRTRPGFESTVAPLDTAAVTRAAKRGVPLRLPQDCGADVQPQALGAAKSVIVYPLKTAERLVGVLTISRYAESAGFRRADVESISALAVQVTLALENVRLGQQTVTNERLASIGQLAAGVAHEIKNPVSYVMASLEWLQESLGAEAPALTAEEWPQIHAALKDAVEGAGRIRDIVGDLKNMSRADTGKHGMVDMNEVVRAALRISAAEVRHRTKVVLQLGEGVQTHGDPGRLTQVLVNLVVNAAQAVAEHRSEGGAVTIRSWLKGGQAKVSVSDNGPGIPVENQARVFETFFTTKAPGVGTGLGLPISRDIARAHGGDIQLKSVAGEGACFTVSLPGAGEGAMSHTA